MPFEANNNNDEDTDSSSPMALLKRRLAGFETEEGRLKGLGYVPQEQGEVAISTTPKAGTTWMQQICHQLRLPRDDNFDEISRVVPWLELAHDQGQDLQAPQIQQEQQPQQQSQQDDNNNNSTTTTTTTTTTPVVHHHWRFFKTHAWADHCPNFPKVIVVVRDPVDVVVSFFRFFEGWFFEPHTIQLEDFAREFWLARDVPQNRMQNASYFVHLRSWYQAWQQQQQQQQQPEQQQQESKDVVVRHPQVLMVCFEDMKEDLEAHVRLVADFLDRPLPTTISTKTTKLMMSYQTPDRIAAATEYASYSYMKANAHLFDEKLSKQARNEACGLPPDAGMHGGGKIRTGTSGQNQISDALRSEIQTKWQQVVAPVTGCQNYAELRAQLAAVNFGKAKETS